MNEISLITNNAMITAKEHQIIFPFAHDIVMLYYELVPEHKS